MCEQGSLALCPAHNARGKMFDHFFLIQERSGRKKVDLRTEPTVPSLKNYPPSLAPKFCCPRGGQTPTRRGGRGGSARAPLFLLTRERTAVCHTRGKPPHALACLPVPRSRRLMRGKSYAGRVGGRTRRNNFSYLRQVLCVETESELAAHSRTDLCPS